MDIENIENTHLTEKKTSHNNFICRNIILYEYPI